MLATIGAPDIEALFVESKSGRAAVRGRIAADPDRALHLGDRAEPLVLGLHQTVVFTASHSHHLAPAGADAPDVSAFC